MVAWTGIEQFRVGRFDPPPPAEEPEDFVVCLHLPITCDFIPSLIPCFPFLVLYWFMLLFV